MNDAIRQLISMAPGVAAGLKGNGTGMQAFMEAYQRQTALMDENDRRNQVVSQQGEDRTAARTRQVEQDKIAAEARARQLTQQGQADALQRLQIPGQLAELGGTAQTPEDAQRLIESAMPDLMKAFGDQTMAYGQPAVEIATRTITARQKRQVSEFVDAALKTSFVADNQDADPEITNLPNHIVQMLGKPTAKLSELQTFAQMPVGKPAGKTRVPAMAGSFEDYVEKKYGPNATADQILEARKAYQQSDDRPRITVNTGGGLPPNVQRRLDAAIKGFDSQPVVKTIQKMAEAASFAESLDPNTTNPADDQALIYAFAKAMDPDSVVREGEYATIQKYAQSWAQTFGFNAARIFSNTSFLTPEARANLKATIRSKYAAGRTQYDNVRNEYGRRIDKITGKSGGVDELTDYGAAFPQQSATPAPKPAQAPASASGGPAIKERRKINGVLAEWDGKGWLPVVK